MLVLGEVPEDQVEVAQRGIRLGGGRRLRLGLVLGLRERGCGAVGGVEREVVDLGPVRRGGTRGVHVERQEDVGLRRVGGRRPVLQADGGVAVPRRHDPVAAGREDFAHRPRQCEDDVLLEETVRSPCPFLGPAVTGIDHHDARPGPRRGRRKDESARNRARGRGGSERHRRLRRGVRHVHDEARRVGQRVDVGGKVLSFKDDRQLGRTQEEPGDPRVVHRHLGDRRNEPDTREPQDDLLVPLLHPERRRPREAEDDLRRPLERRDRRLDADLGCLHAPRDERAPALVPDERDTEQGGEDAGEEVRVGEGGGALTADGRGELDELRVDDGEGRLRSEDRHVRPDLQLVGGGARLVRHRPAQRRRDVAHGYERLSVGIHRPDQERRARGLDERRRRRRGTETGPDGDQDGQKGKAKKEGGPGHSPGL